MLMYYIICRTETMGLCSQVRASCHRVRPARRSQSWSDRVQLSHKRGRAIIHGKKHILHEACMRRLNIEISEEIHDLLI